MNTTLTARIPRLRLVMTMRLETTFLNYRRNLSENRTTIALDQAGDVTGTPYDGQKDRYVAVYPEYYSTWDNPTARIPFAEARLVELQQLGHTLVCVLDTYERCAYRSLQLHVVVDEHY